MGNVVAKGGKLVGNGSDSWLGNKIFSPHDLLAMNCTHGHARAKNTSRKRITRFPWSNFPRSLFLSNQRNSSSAFRASYVSALVIYEPANV